MSVFISIDAKKSVFISIPIYLPAHALLPLRPWSCATPRGRGRRPGLAPRGSAKWRVTDGGGTSVVRQLRALVLDLCLSSSSVR